MRKTVIGAATIALLSTTALVSAQQTQEPKDQPSAKEQGPASGSATRTEKSAEPRADTGDKGKRAQGQGSDSDRKGRAEKSDSQQDRKGSAQKQGDQSKDRTAEPKSGDAAKGKTAEPKDRADDSKSKAAEPKDGAGDRKQDAARGRDEPGKQRDQAQGKDGKDGPRGDQARQGKDGKDGPRGDQAQQGKDGKDGQRGDQARQGKDGQRDGDRANLSQDQRVQVRERLGRNREARHTNVNFSINVGTRVPRGFRLAVVPTDIIAIVPAYRGYRYFIVEERVIIVHPTRYEIVEVIEVDGPRRGGSVTASLDLSGPQMALILDRIPRDRHRADVSVDLALGAEVPSSVELYEFPAEVVAEVPSIRQYRYVVLERRVLIVNPSGRDVVRVIDR